MLERCYSAKLKEIEPTYIGCEASDNFKNYQFFARWCQDQIGFKNKGWQLDKDILIKGNKLYSEDTCVFVPREINNFLTLRVNHRGEHPIGVHWHKGQGKFVSSINEGNKRRTLGYFKSSHDAFLRYAQEKELVAKRLAEQWVDLIDTRVVHALKSFKIEIGD